MMLSHYFIQQYMLGRKIKSLILGISGSWILPFIKILRPTLKLIVNIDGVEWRREKWSSKTRKLLKCLERLAIKFSDTVIADNAVIVRYLNKNYKSPKVSMIAYGGDHVLTAMGSEDSVSKNYALTICRIEKENNVDLMLDACAHTNQNYVVIGNWAVSEYAGALYKKYKNYDNINLIGPIYDQHVLNYYRSNCDFYIHGHSAGGSNPSLIEIMFYKKLIVSYSCFFNKKTLDNNGIFFHRKDDLVKILSDINPFDESNKSIASEAEKYAKIKYSWKNIALGYGEIFENFNN